MTDQRRSRPIPLALTSLVAFFSALVALVASNGMDMAQAHGNTPHAHAATAMTVTIHRTPMLSAKAVSLRMGMRKLWEDHVTWTRLAIISLTTGSPDTQATVGRLLQNQADIGNAIKPFYGATAGGRLTALLRRHILIAADLIAAAKGGDQTKLADAQRRWEGNADEIATFLSKANPRAWRLAEMKTMLREHLALTTAEAVARLQGNWAADVAAYDKIHRQALQMADMLTAGIVKQFPRRFR